MGGTITIDTKHDLGVVRKQIGLSFVGETREGEHWVFADVRLKGVDKEVSLSAFFNVQSHMRMISSGMFGEISKMERKQPSDTIYSNVQ
jgi:hypothetical protein